MAIHRLDASPETVHWGYFDAGLKPLLTVESGDTVTFSTVSGQPTQVPKPGSGLAIPPALVRGSEECAAREGVDPAELVRKVVEVNLDELVANGSSGNGEAKPKRKRVVGGRRRASS